MGIFEISCIGIGLAMDAFAVSICKGLSIKNIKVVNILKIALYFGIFQGIMPIIGFFLGYNFQDVLISIDHWIAFSLLLIIGGKMINDSLKINDEEKNDLIDIKTMLILAIATSIDALAIGITFAFFKINIIYAGLIICIITFILSSIGVIIGNKFGDKFQNKAEIAGGVILILIGLKILFEHLEIIKILQ